MNRSTFGSLAMGLLGMAVIGCGAVNGNHGNDGTSGSKTPHGNNQSLVALSPVQFDFDTFKLTEDDFSALQIVTKAIDVRGFRSILVYGPDAKEFNQGVGCHASGTGLTGEALNQVNQYLSGLSLNANTDLTVLFGMDPDKLMESTSSSVSMGRVTRVLVDGDYMALTTRAGNGPQTSTTVKPTEPGSTTTPSTSTDDTKVVCKGKISLRVLGVNESK